MNLISARNIVHLLNKRIEESIKRVDNSGDSDLRDWLFYCRSDITEIKHNINKLEDYMLYNKISMDKDFKDLTDFSAQEFINFITNHIDLISSKVTSLEIKSMEIQKLTKEENVS